jgi:hypothetical protein
VGRPRGVGATALDVEIGQASLGETGLHGRVVVAAVQAQQLDLVEQAVGGKNRERGLTV